LAVFFAAVFFTATYNSLDYGNPSGLPCLKFNLALLANESHEVR
jgi:hypothetical protein